MVTFLALLFSVIGFALLALTDAKRHRRGRLRFNLRQSQRIVVVLITVLPGAILPSLGLYSGLLVWVGGCTVLGWLVALVPSRLL